MGLYSVRAKERKKGGTPSSSQGGVTDWFGGVNQTKPDGAAAAQVYDTVCKNDPQISQIPQIYESVVNVFQSVKSVESVDVFRFNANGVVHPGRARGWAIAIDSLLAFRVLLRLVGELARPAVPKGVRPLHMGS